MTDLVEELHWVRREYYCRGVEEWERHRKEPWHAPNTRSHEVTEKGIAREERLDSIELTDSNAEDVASLLIGRTIVGFTREPHSGESWGDCENSITITLDDGSRLELDGWGYDASGLNAAYTQADTDSYQAGEGHA